MDPMLLYPGKSLVLPNLHIDDIARNTRFLILSLPNNDMCRKLPFAIHKALIGIGGEPQSVKRLRSGDLLIETSSALQTKSFLLAKTFLDSLLTISPHKSLNTSRGVISEPDLLSTPKADNLNGFSDQGVIQILTPATSNSFSSSNKALSLNLSMFTPLPAETCPAVETETFISNIIASTSQDTKQTSKSRKKRRPKRILKEESGRGSRVVLASDRGWLCHEFEPSTTKDPRVGQRCTLNLSRSETSSRWCGVVVRRGGASSGVVHVT
ncbi:uncharacterized protein TNCV_175361 [Trichonephila clavipes]|nr:uncharacterized protein TNCV_175361 [Trichonephila clavipes]